MEMHAVRVIEIDPDKGDYAVTVTNNGAAVKGVSLTRISAVEERVMEWPTGAPHIHSWFKHNVGLSDEEEGEVEFDVWRMRDLLSACIQVLSSSELREYEPDDEDEEDDPEKGTLLIKDTALARSLLPIPAPEDVGETEYRFYDVNYLRQVEQTRDWVHRMLSENASNVPGTIFYRYSIG
jgi:hypothetical protein